MLLLQNLDSLFLLVILVRILLHHAVLLNVQYVLLELYCELVDERDVLGPYPHDHVTHVVLPPGDIEGSIFITHYRLLSAVPYLIVLIQLCDIALINVLHIFFTDEAGQALEALLFRRVEVEATSMDFALLSQVH